MKETNKKIFLVIIIWFLLYTIGFRILTNSVLNNFATGVIYGCLMSSLYNYLINKVQGGKADD